MQTRNLKLLILFLIISIINTQNIKSQTYCVTNSDQVQGIQDGYRYELWNQNSQGTACITLGKGALFSGKWDGIENYLARRGLSYNQTQCHKEIGSFQATYNCNYTPSPEKKGNSYLAIYGWTIEPLIEYYIVEDWRNWIPSMAKNSILKGSFKANGGIYDVYETIRENQPSIKGTATFKQYFSIRRKTRNTGKINISKHFEMWEKYGMKMGKMHEVSFVVEGYQNSGSFNFKELEVLAK